MGVPNQEGVKLAIKEINANGGINGKQVEVVYYDDEGDPATSVTQATKMVQQSAMDLSRGKITFCVYKGTSEKGAENQALVVGHLK